MGRPAGARNSMQPFLSLGPRGHGYQCFSKCCDCGGIILLLSETKCPTEQEKERNTPTCVSSCLHISCQHLLPWSHPSRYQSPKESGPSGPHGSTSEGKEGQILDLAEHTENKQPTWYSCLSHQGLGLVIPHQILDSITEEELGEPFLATIEVI